MSVLQLPQKKPIICQKNTGFIFTGVPVQTSEYFQNMRFRNLQKITCTL